MNCLLIGAIAPSIGNAVSAGCLPFGAMALSGYLIEHGIDCKVVSTAIPGSEEEISNALSKADLLGISSMSGPYLNYAISIVNNIRKIKPDLPIVWGGPHASLMGEDLISKNLADFVIKGVGERSLFLLIKGLKQKDKFSSIPGLIWKEEGVIKSNDPDKDFDINDFPKLDYSFVEEKYPFLLREEFNYFTSRGCPFDCSYCVASVIYNRRWCSKKEEKVKLEIKEAYDKFKFKSIMFWDDNLFVDTKRLMRIISELKKEGIIFQWSGFCRADIFSNLEDEVIKELKNNGLKWISIGAESGSQKILDSLSKGIKVGQIKEAVIKLKKWGILCDLSFMGGLPQERAEDFKLTLDLVGWIKEIYPSASVRVFRFIPYPKMPILKNIENFSDTDTYGWSRVLYQSTKFPWVPKRVNRALNILAPASFYSYRPTGLSLKNLIISGLFYITQFRFKTKFFYFPLEGVIIERIYNRICLEKFNIFQRRLYCALIKSTNSCRKA